MFLLCNKNSNGFLNYPSRRDRKLYFQLRLVLKNVIYLVIVFNNIFSNIVCNFIPIQINIII